MDAMRRKPSTNQRPGYPNAAEALQHRREFLALLTKAALGVSVLGVIGCDGGDGGGQWTPSGKDVHVEDLTTYDLSGTWRGVDAVDTKDDVRLAGLPDLPDLPDNWPMPGGDTAPKDANGPDMWSLPGSDVQVKDLTDSDLVDLEK